MNELQVQLRPVSALVPYRKNARTHSDDQVSQIARSIEEFGWTGAQARCWLGPSGTF